MENILGNIYCFFQSLFGSELRDHLWGYVCGDGGFGNPNIFNQIGGIMILVSLLVAITYYYVINSPRFYKWGHWLIMLVINVFINFAIAAYWTITDLTNGVIQDCLMYMRDTEGNIVDVLITNTHCYGFAAANAIISLAVFFIWSMLIKWGSSAARYSPF